MVDPAAGWSYRGVLECYQLLIAQGTLPAAGGPDQRSARMNPENKSV